MEMNTGYKLQWNKDAYIMICGTITHLKHQSNRWALVANPALLKTNQLYEQDQASNLSMNELGAN